MYSDEEMKIAKEEMNKDLEKKDEETRLVNVSETKEELLDKFNKLENDKKMSDIEKEYHELKKKNRELETRLLEKNRGKATLLQDVQVQKPNTEIEEFKKQFPMLGRLYE